jgi:hypothetical protein
MNASRNDQIAVDEEIWRAWVHKGNQRDQASTRRGRILIKIALVILTVGLAFYFLSARSTLSDLPASDGAVDQSGSRKPVQQQPK